MGKLFAATLLLSVSLNSNAKYGDECETFEPSTEEVSRVRSMVGDAVPADAELSSACILMKSERFAPTVEWAKGLTYEYMFVWLVESGASGTRFYRESSCLVFPTERVSCSDSGRLARMEDGLWISIDDSITDADLQSLLAILRRMFGDSRIVSSVSREGADSESEFEILFAQSQGHVQDEEYHLTRLCEPGVETLEKCKWKLDGPYRIAY